MVVIGATAGLNGRVASANSVEFARTGHDASHCSEQAKSQLAARVIIPVSI
jgi:hypothetical protein